jgi:DNA polymerase III epsilon subunit-like protein
VKPPIILNIGVVIMTKYIFLDTETTGLDPHVGGHRIIDLACIEYEDATPTGNVFNLKINPEGKISVKKAFQLHGILDEELVDMPTFKGIHK